MTAETIEYLQKLMNGDNVFLSKDSPDEVIEVSDRLYNLGLLYKPARYQFAISSDKRKYVAKLIKLGSWTDFLDWMDRRNDKSQIKNDFSYSNIGQLNQSEYVEVDRIDALQASNTSTIEKSNTSLIQKIYWIVGIVIALYAIYKIVQEVFFV